MFDTCCSAGLPAHHANPVSCMRAALITQSFSLAQFDPPALVKLRRTGECDFSISEALFDVDYPGHYRRHVRAIHLSIPCVGGPYTSGGATLRLNKSYLRTETRTDASAKKEIPLRHSAVTATGTAQNDSGLLEFSFRDEAFMPFEEAGAISDWTLTLPKDSQSFDFTTISDVIIRVSYAAQETGVAGSTAS